MNLELELHPLKPTVMALLVVAASFLTYANTLNSGFVFDDHRGILTNNDLDPEKTSLWELFQNDFWGGRMSRVESHKSYRPFTVLTYRYLNYYFTELRPFSYHLVNVLMHCVASVLFLFVCQIVLGGRSKWPAFAAFLFAVHSIHTEVVASVVGRAEVVSCIFFLLALLLYVKAVSVGSGDSILPTPRSKWLYVLASVTLGVCAMLSKEQGITALGACASFDALLHWEALKGMVRKRLPGRAVKDLPKSCTDCGGNISESGVMNGLRNSKAGWESGRLKRKSSIPKDHDLHVSAQGAIWRLVVLAAAGLLLLWFRISMNYNSDPIFKSEELKAAFHPNRSVRIMSFSNIYAINAWLLLAPSSLCCDWSLGSVPLVTSFVDVRNIWSMTLYVGLVILVLHVFKSKRDRFQVGMALALLLLPFIPASGIVFKVGFVIAERVLYMPSLGFCLLVTVGARRLSTYIHSKGLKGIFWVFMIFLVAIMAIKSVRRNMDWASDISLFESGVEVNPNNVKLHNNYAMELKAAGRVGEAREQYQLAMKIDPDYGEVYFNYGNLLSDEGEFEAAAASFDKAIRYPQMYAKTLNNLATMHFRLSHWQQAEERFKESLELTPNQATTYNNLASLYGETKRYKESEEMFRKALELNPTYTEAYFNLGTLLFQMGRMEEAESSLKHALTLHPNHYGAANNLKVVQHHKLKMQQQRQK